MHITTERIIMLLCGIPALVAGLTLHEFAHAWAADKLGDDTARRQGRLTLDPLVHIDPLGALFYLVSALAGFGMGWAKPVMTNPRNLRHPHRDGLLIAIAGPISNILQTPFWLAAIFVYSFVLTKMGHSSLAFMGLGEAGTGAAYFISLALIQGVVINLSLAAFNMVPIPPLDGHWVLGALAGEPVRRLYDQIRPYSFFLLMVLINYPNPSLFDRILEPVVRFAYQCIITALGWSASGRSGSLLNLNRAMTESPPMQPPVKDPERFNGHKIRLPIFEGSLDLLLYLIRAHKYDVFDIPIREITGQFVEYLTLMNEVEADYAGDFLVTAATLMQIKARMLLPKTASESEEALQGDEDSDPRHELVERLLEYQRLQEAANELKTRREERADLFGRSPQALKQSGFQGADLASSLLLADVSSFDLLSALKRVLRRFEAQPVALIQREPFSLPERLQGLQIRLYHTGELTFEAMCDDCASRLEIVVTFLAILELIKRGHARLRQLTLFDEIYLESV